MRPPPTPGQSREGTGRPPLPASPCPCRKPGVGGGPRCHRDSAHPQGPASFLPWSHVTKAVAPQGPVPPPPEGPRRSPQGAPSLRARSPRAPPHLPPGPEGNGAPARPPSRLQHLPRPRSPRKPLPPAPVGRRTALFCSLCPSAFCQRRTCTPRDLIKNCPPEADSFPVLARAARPINRTTVRQPRPGGGWPSPLRV